MLPVRMGMETCKVHMVTEHYNARVHWKAVEELRLKLLNLSPQVMEARIKKKMLQVAPFLRQMSDADMSNALQRVWSNMRIKA